MPLQATSGAASYDGFGGGVAAIPNYIEDVFSTWLYTGTGATQTITNGVDLSGKGGLVWIKNRNVTSLNHNLFNTTQGATKLLHSNTIDSIVTDSVSLTSFNSTGFTLGTGATSGSQVNSSNVLFASWTFRKQPKFFDVVTYTGDGTTARAISHNLGSAPACMFVRRTDTAADWRVYHIGCAANNALRLNGTDAQAATGPDWFGNSSTTIAPTATQFTINGVWTNASGGTYVAYLFADNAGGFGLTGTDNVISCGSFTTDASGISSVTLGYEPQWVMVKRINSTGNWIIEDIMRGAAYSYNGELRANTTDVELTTSGSGILPNATGFSTNTNFYLAGSSTYIYIAIRRGPMKVPTDATKVFSPQYATFSGTTVTDTGFVVDTVINKNNVNSASDNYVIDRLRGAYDSAQATVLTNSNSPEATSSGLVSLTQNTTPTIQNGFLQLNTSSNSVVWAFRRAPGFFDEVCYTGSGTNTTKSHNLTVAPELILVKSRQGFVNWSVYSSALANTEYLLLNSNAAKITSTSVWNSTTPTSSVFSLGNDLANYSATNYVAYLFASCPGVSKVGSYSGTGATQTISCGFTGGARFVLIKRTNSTGDWYVWDTARGMVSGTDPSLLLNSTAAAVNANSIYTTTGGFQIVSTAAGINASGGTYIYLAIA